MLRDGNMDSSCDLPMQCSDAKGVALLHDGDRFGADIIEFPPGGRVAPHSHPGAHMLFVLSGSGIVIRSGDETRLVPRTAYLVSADEPHSVNAGPSGLRLLVVGNDHRPVDSEDRLVAVE